jgi:hypothetical protein
MRKLTPFGVLVTVIVGAMFWLCLLRVGGCL